MQGSLMTITVWRMAHGATLKLDIEQGRFVFFYLPVSA
jgi:hypothetical protein